MPEQVAEQKTATIYEGIKKQSIAILESGVEVQPVIFFFTPDGELVVGPSPMLVDSKEHGADAARDMTRELIARLVATMPVVITVNEVWTARYIHGDTRAPSSRKDRGEAIVINLYSEGKHTITSMLMFNRDPSDMKNVKHDGKWIESGFASPPGSIFPPTGEERE